MCAVAVRSRQKSSISRIPGARKGSFPGFIEFCDPALRARPPSSQGWVYEIKADGYRAQLHIRDGRTTVYSRAGHDWTEQFSTSLLRLAS